MALEMLLMVRPQFINENTVTQTPEQDCEAITIQMNCLLKKLYGGHNLAGILLTTLQGSIHNVKLLNLNHLRKTLKVFVIHEDC
jgi:hypothetical protein